MDGVQEVFETLGLCGGKLISNGNGYFYRVHEKREGKSARLKCHITTCTGKATLLIESGIKIIKLTSAHQPHCLPDPEYPEVVQLRMRMISRSKGENTKLSVIFNEECNK